jgi:hypothetical protein
MNTPARDFVTVDMRGTKAALLAHAQAERVSVSLLVRRAVARELDRVHPSGARGAGTHNTTSTHATVKLSIRLPSAEAEQLDAGARRAELSRGAFLAGLLAQVPSLTGGLASRPEYLAALTASSAELSTLSRNIHHLTLLLRQSNVRAAQEYRRTLDTLSDDVRAHLTLAARALAELRPARQPRPGDSPSLRATSRRQGDRHVPTS